MRKNSKKAFTLVELVMTLAVTSIAVVLIMSFIGAMNVYSRQSLAMTNTFDFTGSVRQQAANWVTRFDTEDYHFEIDEDAVVAVSNVTPDLDYRMYFADGYFCTEFPGLEEPLRSEKTDCFDRLEPFLRTNDEGQTLFRMLLYYSEYGQRIMDTKEDRYSFFVTTRTRTHSAGAPAETDTDTETVTETDTEVSTEPDTESGGEGA